MHVCHLTQSVTTLGGGISEVVRALSSAQESHRHRVSIVSTPDSGEALTPWPDGSPKWLRAQRLPGLLRFPDLAAFLDQENPDLTHVHGLWTWLSVGVPKWASRRGRPQVISPHGMLDPWAMARSRLKKNLAAFAFENRHLGRASCLHALCQPEADAIRALGFKTPLCIIPNAIDLPKENSEEEEDLKIKSHKSGEPKVLLFLGRIHPKKGLVPALRAWAEVQSREEWRFVIAGWDQDGHEAELKHLCDELGMSYGKTPVANFLTLSTDSDPPTPVIFTGPAFGVEKDALLRRASAFILPSFSEGLPMSILEAWAYRLPVIMTDHCNLPEGFAAEAAVKISTDVESIAEGMRSLLRAPTSNLRSLGQNGRLLVERQFTWPQVAAQLQEVYSWLLDSGEKPDCVRRS